MFSISGEAVGTILGAVIAGMASLLVLWVTQDLTARNERRTWEREKLFNAYSDCIYYLVKLSMSAMAEKRDDKEVRQHLSESQRYLNILSLYNRDDKTLIKSRDEIENNWRKTIELANAAERALNEVKRLFGADRRLIQKDLNSRS